MKERRMTSQDLLNRHLRSWTTLAGSRFLHDAETRYAPVEGELLAVAYALHQCRYYVLGCPDLTIATDHQPLLTILNDRSLANMQNSRLLNLPGRKTLALMLHPDTLPVTLSASVCLENRQRQISTHQPHHT